MFTFKPASKNGSNSNSQGDANGSTNGNGNSNGNGHKNGSSNGSGHAPISGWLGLGSGQKTSIGPKSGNGHLNGNGRSNKIESVVGPGLALQGKLTGAGGIRIEGSFDGSIAVNGSVVVADGAKVTADIQAYAVSVSGTVQGNITATKVEIRSTGRIFGDLVTTTFATEEGAFLRGQVRMEDDVTAGPPAQLVAPATMAVTQPEAVTAVVQPAETVDA